MRNRDGVMEGVQHNTYDVEFYGPNPLVQCLVSGGAAGRRRDGARAGRQRRGRRVPAAVRKRQRAGSTRICSTASTTFSRCAAFRRADRASDDASDMGAEDPETSGFSVGGWLPGGPVDRPVFRGCRGPGTAAGARATSARRWNPFTSTTTSGTVRSRFGAARLRLERRSRAADLRLHAKAAGRRFRSRILRK